MEAIYQYGKGKNNFYMQKQFPQAFLFLDQKHFPKR